MSTDKTVFELEQERFMSIDRAIQLFDDLIMKRSMVYWDDKEEKIKQVEED